jgi:small-conductance mechanosensitive channel
MLESPLFLFIFLVVGIGLFFVLQRIENQKRKEVKESSSLVDDFFFVFILSLRPWVYISLVLLAGSYIIAVPEIWEDVRSKTILILGTYQAILSLAALGVFLLQHLNSAEEKERRVFRAFSKVFSLVLWAIGILFILSNFGINITALLAGLGIGGLAFAFAFQNILEDLFSYMTILLDAPVKEGDAISVAGAEGVVKNIGIKTTRLRTSGGEEIVIANSTITSSELINYGKAKKRRITFSLFIDESISEPQLGGLIDELTKIVNSIDDLEHKSTHLKGISSMGLELQTVYFVKSRGIDLHRHTRTDLHRAIHGYLRAEDIELFKTATERKSTDID